MNRWVSLVVGCVSGVCLACSTQDVVVQLDLPSTALFLHADTIVVTVHDVPEDVRPLDECNARETELLTTGFTEPPLDSYGPFGACEFYEGAAALDGLQSDSALLIAAVHDGTGTLIATGCQPITLTDLPLPMDQRTPTVTIVLEDTMYYRTRLATMEPPYSSIEMRCGM